MSDECAPSLELPNNQLWRVESAVGLSQKGFPTNARHFSADYHPLAKADL
jgi:hypothetical protein